ncbi:MAG TPA: hypothetical protein PLM16_00210 [Candidatus Woesebacteria bacterium]|nr:hypothetical protein [Candidatus Woesebacteria bacterium]
MGPVSEDSIPKVQTLDSMGMASGFYLVDLDSRSIKYLSALGGPNFVSWLDNTKLLLKIGNNNNQKYVVFDLKTLEADAQILDKKFDNYFCSQFSINAVGSKWAFTLIPTEGMNSSQSESKVILASFPSLEGRILGEARFARVQNPLISPDGKMVTFISNDGANGPNFVNLYNGESSERLFEGLSLKWLDNSNFIYGVVNPSYASNPNLVESLYVYNVETGESNQIY